MALTQVERNYRWREKNRDKYNEYQRKLMQRRRGGRNDRDTERADRDTPAGADGADRGVAGSCDSDAVAQD